MKTRAVRMHGAMDLRIDEFELPEIKDDEMLVRIMSDSICMSTYKMAKLGAEHKRVPENIAEHPVITGHEFAGDIVEVGAKYKDLYQPGQKFTIQPALNYKGSMDSPGYSYEFCGGDATYCILPMEVFDADCFFPYNGEAYYQASLIEPVSCSVGAFHATYHTSMTDYIHRMGIREGGNLAIMAGAGPMGLGALTYAIHRDVRPARVVVTDINQERLDRAASLYTVEFAKSRGIELHYVNTAVDNPVELLKGIAGGEGYDDVFCFAPVAPVVEQADDILAFDGCLNFFAGPGKAPFKAPFNFYNVHYNSTHVVGTSGGNTDDMKEALHYMGLGMDPAGLVTHVGGLNAVVETTLNLPDIPGGKKLIYTHVTMPLTAIADFGKVGKPVYDELDRLCKAHKGLWNAEAEKYLLAHADEL